MERWLAHHDDRLDVVEDVAQAAHERLDKAAHAVGDHGQRLQRLELTIAGGATVTDAQAAAISEAVRALAFTLKGISDQLGKAEKDKNHGPHDPRGANPYQRVYSELYRKFRVPSYRALPLESFPAVMRWLVDWWEAIADEPPPFGAHDVGGQLGS